MGIPLLYSGGVDTLEKKRSVERLDPETCPSSLIKRKGMGVKETGIPGRRKKRRENRGAFLRENSPYWGTFNQQGLFETGLEGRGACPQIM